MRYSRGMCRSMLPALSLLPALLVPVEAFAYLDPATGSLILQGALAAVFAAAFTVKTYWYRLKSMFGGSADDSQQLEDEHEDEDEDEDAS